MLSAICQSAQFAKCALWNVKTAHAQFANFRPKPKPNSNLKHNPNPNLILILTRTKSCTAFCKLRRLRKCAQHMHVAKFFLRPHLKNMIAHTVFSISWPKKLGFVVKMFKISGKYKRTRLTWCQSGDETWCGCDTCGWRRDQSVECLETIVVHGPSFAKRQFNTQHSLQLSVLSVCTAVTATTTITITNTITTTTKNPNHSYQKLLTFNKTSASARSISCHMAPVNVHNSAIPGAIPQNRRRPIWNVARLPCKISHRLVKPWLKNL